MALASDSEVWSSQMQKVLNMNEVRILHITQ